jgi:hypothetical protein
MSTSIRSACNTFEEISNEIKRTTQALETSKKETESKKDVFQEEMNTLMNRLVESIPPIESWPDSVMKSAAMSASEEYDDMVKKLNKRLSKLSDNTDAIKQLTPIVDKKEKDRNLAHDFIIHNPINALNTAFNLKDMNRLQASLPPPSFFSMKNLRASVQERNYWKIVKEYEKNHGPNSFTKDFENYKTQLEQHKFAGDQYSQVKGHLTDLENEQRQRNLLTRELNSKVSKDVFVKDALNSALKKGSPDEVATWLQQFPNVEAHIKAYLFKKAQLDGTVRISNTLDAYLKAVKNINGKIDPALSKLRKGRSRAGSKMINIDANGIKEQVLSALKQMSPVSASTATALDKLSGLRINKEPSQQFFYNKGINKPNQSSNINYQNCSHSSDWLLYWLLFVEFSQSNDVNAQQSADLALGMNGIGEQFYNNGLTMDAFNANIPSVDVASNLGVDLISGGNDWNMPNIDTQNIQNIDSGMPNFDPNVFTPDLNNITPDFSLPDMSSQMNFDIPNITVDVPNITVDIPTITVDVPTIDVSMPSIDISSSSFDSSGGGW